MGFSAPHHFPRQARAPSPGACAATAGAALAACGGVPAALAEMPPAPSGINTLPVAGCKMATWEKTLGIFRRFSQLKIFQGTYGTNFLGFFSVDFHSLTFFGELIMDVENHKKYEISTHHLMLSHRKPNIRDVLLEFDRFSWEHLAFPPSLGGGLKMFGCSSEPWRFMWLTYGYL